ncbi:MAG TPA: SDR family oxidoreductase [Xanthobacteraceae bacterium]|jgi:NAD(P)-dependent dehydrogenase (short-subunit alcohol dehydrogenase family)
MTKLSGKAAIVTGAARGIGLAIAKRFVAEGAKVMLSDINETDGAAAAKALGVNARFTPCDVGDSAAVNKLIGETVKNFGGVDILVNNAGIIHTADFLDIKEADFDRVMRVNMKGVFLVGQAAARRMVEQVKAGKKPGAIVNMSSTSAVVVIANQVPYAASKGAVGQLTRVMALALAPYGIRVNAIGPGSIMTEILKGIATDKEAKRRILSRTPLGRVGEPEEVAAVAAFLASDDASYMTGETVYVDGGRLSLNYTVPVKDEALD